MDEASRIYDEQSFLFRRRDYTLRAGVGPEHHHASRYGSGVCAPKLLLEQHELLGIGVNDR